MSSVMPSAASWTATPPLTLLVDRDSDTRRLYAAYLQMSNCDIEEAEDGREALAELRPQARSESLL